MNKNKKSVKGKNTVKNTPIVSGIDALYYFASSHPYYDNFYLDILSQIEAQKERFKAYDYQYNDKDIIVKIQDTDFIFSGISRDGYHAFNSDYVRLSFKDPEKNKNLKDIKIQLNAKGIYTIGLKSLIEYVNEHLLKDLTLGDFPITRIDLNTFVNTSLSFITREMIISKKKSYSEITKEIGSIRETETFYIGKKPFLLRIYNKKRELERSDKKELMLNYFGINGLDIEKDVWNIEFELSREFLKSYGIGEVYQALERAETLFRYCMQQIRLIDLDSISHKALNSTNRNKAETLPFWEYIQNAYSLKEFMQIETPLSRIDKISQRYSMGDAQKTIVKILKRLHFNDRTPTKLFMDDCFSKAIDDIELIETMKRMKNNRVNPLIEKAFKCDDKEFFMIIGKASDEELIELRAEFEPFASDSPPDIEASNRLFFINDEMDKRHLSDEIDF